MTKPEGLPEAFEAYEPVCPAFDVDLGELRQFDEPLEMEIPYDKSKLEDVGIKPEEGVYRRLLQRGNGLLGRGPLRGRRGCGASFA